MFNLGALFSGLGGAIAKAGKGVASGVKKIPWADLAGGGDGEDEGAGGDVGGNWGGVVPLGGVRRRPRPFPGTPGNRGGGVHEYGNGALAAPAPVERALPEAPEPGRMAILNRPAEAVSIPPAPALPPPEQDNALPQFSNDEKGYYDKMRWRGGVDYGGERGGDKQQYERYKWETRDGKMAPGVPLTKKDRIREALLGAAGGALQGARDTGDWRGAIAGAGVGGAAGAINPRLSRRATYNTFRQGQQEAEVDRANSLQSDQLKQDALREGIAGQRADRADRERRTGILEAEQRQSQGRWEKEHGLAERQVASQEAVRQAQAMHDLITARVAENKSVREIAAEAMKLAQGEMDIKKIINDINIARERLKLEQVSTGADVSLKKSQEDKNKLETGQHEKMISWETIRGYANDPQNKNPKTGKPFTEEEAARLFLARGYKVGQVGVPMKQQER